MISGREAGPSTLSPLSLRSRSRFWISIRRTRNARLSMVIEGESVESLETGIETASAGGRSVSDGILAATTDAKQVPSSARLDPHEAGTCRVDNSSSWLWAASSNSSSSTSQMASAPKRLAIYDKFASSWSNQTSGVFSASVQETQKFPVVVRVHGIRTSIRRESTQRGFPARATSTFIASTSTTTPPPPPASTGARLPTCRASPLLLRPHPR